MKVVLIGNENFLRRFLPVYEGHRVLVLSDPLQNPRLPRRRPRFLYEVWTALRVALLRAPWVHLFGSHYRFLHRWLRGRVRVIHHWLGSDFFRFADQLPPELWDPELIHLAVTPNLVEGLQKIGIRAHLVPLPVEDFPHPLQPLPQTPRVLFYLPRGYETLYNRDLLERAARHFPEIEFLVVGGGVPPKLPNVKNLGRVPHDRMAEVLDRSTLVLRMLPHDTLAIMVLEALLRGRYVIWNQPRPGVFYAKTPNEAFTYLARIGELQRLNETGRRYVRENYNLLKIRAQLLSLLPELFLS